jgi:hypothetical protein
MFLPTIGSYIADALEGKKRETKKEWQFSEREWRKDVTRPGDVVKDLKEVGLVNEEGFDTDLLKIKGCLVVGRYV